MRGDVVRIDLGVPPGGSGREEAGSRYGVLVSNDEANNPMVMVVPTTSKIRASRFPHTVEIQPTIKNGLTKISIAMVFQLRSLDKNRILSTVGSIEEQYINRINDELKNMLEI